MAFSKKHKFLLRLLAKNSQNIKSVFSLVICVLASVEYKSFYVRLISQEEKKACVRKLKFVGAGTNTFWYSALKHTKILSDPSYYSCLSQSLWDS